jgi:hypothetical protein
MNISGIEMEPLSTARFDTAKNLSSVERNVVDGGEELTVSFELPSVKDGQPGLFARVKFFFKGIMPDAAFAKFNLACKSLFARLGGNYSFADLCDALHHLRNEVPETAPGQMEIEVNDKAFVLEVQPVQFPDNGARYCLAP